jgi:hypothetical protein
MFVDAGSLLISDGSLLLDVWKGKQFNCIKNIEERQSSL